MELNCITNGNRRADPDAPMEQVRRVTSKVEDVMDANLRWVKPYLPALGRFLIVVTFLEDALRCVTGVRFVS